jgi:hypothetical protein
VTGRARAAWLCSLLGFAAAFNAFAEVNAEYAEPTVKAAFLLKFATYVEWPAQAFAAADTPIVIAVLGSDEVASELERIVPGRSVGGHPVSVRRIADADALKGAHIVFVGRSASARIGAVAKAAQREGVLVITESAGALEEGSAINFVVDDRVGFEVSLTAAERTGHRISARMLAVARRVVGRASS